MGADREVPYHLGPAPPGVGETMRTLFFGTYDERTHPRIQVIREGFEAAGLAPEVCNVPLGVPTEERVRLARQPLRAPILVLQILRCWVLLAWRSRHARPDVVVVGYLGHFDVHFARWRFRRATIVLDHMVGLSDTVVDRGLGEASRTSRLLSRVDRAALRAADVVVVDTVEQGAQLDREAAGDVVVVPVGAPAAWHQAADEHRVTTTPVRVVFFGLFTPLQGAVVIAGALRALPSDAPLRCTMIGSGQDLQAAREALDDDPRVVWIDWVEAEALPAVVAAHDVCLGIFGSGDKAQRVVPNKVYQGAAAGCALVTSDTPCQRRTLADSAILVPPGDELALRDVLADLAANPALVTDLRAAARRLAETSFTPQSVVAPLLERLEPHR